MVTLLSGTNETAWLDYFRLYPNPNTGAFTVDMQGDARQELEFALFNSFGQMVDRLQAGFGAGQLRQNFNYTGQPAGLYTLQIRSGASVLQVKIAIQR
ncbi:MAG: T9SS type A sorting domain-containing protein [Saprospirales bacterium]|nr:T9SS type A sorting domain-containing protein [Saprospirales bacterium]MBK8923433.1 T9SS type A sorting domain-containing protein [Saprospirales bacterium]